MSVAPVTVNVPARATGMGRGVVWSLLFPKEELPLSPWASWLLENFPGARTGLLGEFVEKHASCGMDGRECPDSYRTWGGGGCGALLALASGL